MTDDTVMTGELHRRTMDAWHTLEHLLGECAALLVLRPSSADELEDSDWWEARDWWDGDVPDFPWVASAPTDEPGLAEIAALGDTPFEALDNLIALHRKLIL